MKYFCTEVYQAKIGILIFLKSSLNLVGNFNFKLDNYIHFSCLCFGGKSSGFSVKMRKQWHFWSSEMSSSWNDTLDQDKGIQGLCMGQS